MNAKNRGSSGSTYPTTVQESSGEVGKYLLKTCNIKKDFLKIFNLPKLINHSSVTGCKYRNKDKRNAGMGDQCIGVGNNNNQKLVIRNDGDHWLVVRYNSDRGLVIGENSDWLLKKL